MTREEKFEKAWQPGGWRCVKANQGVSRALRRRTEHLGKRRGKCVVCGKAFTVANNWHYNKAVLCESPVCKRARKTQLPRERRG